MKQLKWFRLVHFMSVLVIIVNIVAMYIVTLYLNTYTLDTADSLLVRSQFHTNS